MRRYLPLMLLALGACQNNEVQTHPTQKVEINYPPPKPMESRKWIAIADFEDKSNYGRGRLGTQMSDVLQKELFASQQFRIFERQQLKHVLDEQKLGGTGLIDPETAVKVGKLKGIQYVVYGAVTNFGLQQSRDGFIVGSTKRWEAKCEVDVKLINVESGEIIWMDSGRGSALSSSTQVMGAGTSAGMDETLSGDCLRAAIVTFVNKLIAAAP